MSKCFAATTAFIEKGYFKRLKRSALPIITIVNDLLK